MRKFHHARCANTPSEPTSCTIILEEDPALSESCKFFLYVALIFHNKKLKITCHWCSHFHQPSAREAVPCWRSWQKNSSAVASPQRPSAGSSLTPAEDDPSDSPTWRETPRDQEQRPPGGKIRTTLTRISICLLSAVVWGGLKKNTHRVNFFKRFFFPQKSWIYPSSTAALEPQPFAALRGEASSRGGHWCPWARELCKEQGKLSQWTPQKSLSEEKGCCSGSSEPRKRQFLILLKQSPLKFTFYTFTMKFYGIKDDSYSKINKKKTKTKP